jgi:putative oxidoreductase
VNQVINKWLRRIFGVLLVIFGLNALFAFIPIPEQHGFALEYMTILHQAKYLFPLIGTIMTLVGVLLLIDKAVGFGLLMLLPISTNIFAFHLFHDWAGLVPSVTIFGLNLYFVFIRYKQYEILFKY